MKNLKIFNTVRRLSTQGKAIAHVVPPYSLMILTRGMTLLKDLPLCITQCEMAFNQDIKALLPLPHADSSFLAYQILAKKNEILNLVDTAGHGTGRLDTDLLKSCGFGLPQIDEQHVIASVMSTWDDAIRVAERLLALTLIERNLLISQLASGKTQCRSREIEEATI